MVSLSKNRLNRISLLEKLSSKHQVEAISLELRTFEHGSIECFSYLKKHDMENYVKEEATDPGRDEVKEKKKKDLVKTKMSISISIGYHMYHP